MFHFSTATNGFSAVTRAANTLEEAINYIKKLYGTTKIVFNNFDFSARFQPITMPPNRYFAVPNFSGWHAVSMHVTLSFLEGIKET